jgi:nitrogen fixation/metabolism regulation signal transduction histidine kinase
MFTLSFNLLQLAIVVFAIVVGILIGQKLVQVLLKIIFTSKPVMAWNMKRQMEQRKLQQKTQREIAQENLKTLASFIEQLDKSFQNNQGRKQWWRDFCDSKEVRQIVINNYLKQFEPKPEVVVPKKDTQNNEQTESK